ncbi:MAG: hypothetical protein ABJL67_13140, partial [Sulfitobacter sp.]
MKNRQPTITNRFETKLEQGGYVRVHRLYDACVRLIGAPKAHRQARGWGPPHGHMARLQHVMTKLSLQNRSWVFVGLLERQRHLFAVDDVLRF